MGASDNEEPPDQKPANPSDGGGTANDHFWDFKASHWVEVLLTAALVFVGIAQLCVYFRQASIMSHQADIANTQNEIIQAQIRPSVFASSIFIDQDLVHSAKGLEIPLGMTLKNVGQTVANHVSFSFKTYLITYNTTEGRDTACRDAEQSLVNWSIFPNETKKQGIAVTVPQSDFDNIADDFKANKGGLMRDSGTTIIACIAYRSTWETKFHHTPYIIQLVTADGMRSLLPQLMLNPNTIPFSSVSVSVGPMFSSLVDGAD